ncbi:hypothetical protein JST97_15875 [bacterium]|nr:hypothetical protein [bacterium]
MRGQPHGLTLLEALMSMFFVMLLMGLFAGLTHEFQSVLKQSESKASTLTTLQLGLRRLLEEVPQALPATISPAPGSSASELRLARPIEDLGAWLPAIAPNTPWSPPSTQIRVRYYVSQGTLYREAGSPPGLQALSQGLNGLTVRTRLGAPLVVEVQLSQLESRRTVVLNGVAMAGRF